MTTYNEELLKCREAWNDLSDKYSKLERENQENINYRCVVVKEKSQLERQIESLKSQLAECKKENTCLKNLLSEDRIKDKILEKIIGLEIRLRKNERINAEGIICFNFENIDLLKLTESIAREIRGKYDK